MTLEEQSFEEAQRQHLARIVCGWSKADRQLFETMYPTRGKTSAAFSSNRVPEIRRRVNIAKLLDQFRGFIECLLPELLELPWPSRVTTDTIDLWVDDLRATCEDATIVQYLGDLQRYAEACSEMSFRWLQVKAKDFGSRPNPKRDDLLDLDAHDLWSITLRYLDRTEGLLLRTTKSTKRRNYAVAYRDALCVGFQTRLPLRMRNLVYLEYGHLEGSWDHDVASRIYLDLSTRHTKNHRSFRAELPHDLVDRLRFYHTFARAYVPRNPGSSSQRLWIGPYGQGLTPIGLHAIIARTSQRLFARRLTCHDFRHICASTGARNGLSRVELAALLQHEEDTRAIEGYIAHWSGQPLFEHRSSFDQDLANALEDTYLIGNP